MDDLRDGSGKSASVISRGTSSGNLQPRRADAVRTLTARLALVAASPPPPPPPTGTSRLVNEALSAGWRERSASQAPQVAPPQRQAVPSFLPSASSAPSAFTHQPPPGWRASGAHDAARWAPALPESDSDAASSPEARAAAAAPLWDAPSPAEDGIEWRASSTAGPSLHEGSEMASQARQPRPVHEDAAASAAQRAYSGLKPRGGDPHAEWTEDQQQQQQQEQQQQRRPQPDPPQQRRSQQQQQQQQQQRPPAAGPGRPYPGWPGDPPQGLGPGQPPALHHNKHNSNHHHHHHHQPPPYPDHERLAAELAAMIDEVAATREQSSYLIERLRQADNIAAAAEARAAAAEERSQSAALELESAARAAEAARALEARVLLRRESALKQRLRAVEEAERVLQEGRAEIVLRAQHATDEAEAEAANLLLRARAAESMVARVMLSREERGCVAAQQAWLRHFWSQAAKLGVHPHMAQARAERWALVCPDWSAALPAAGDAGEPDTDAGDEGGGGGGALDGVRATLADALDAERALREAADVRLEIEVTAAMAARRRPTVVKSREAGEVTLALGLAPVEAETVAFRRAWLRWLWRRAAALGVEPALASHRAHQWDSAAGRPLELAEAVDAESGVGEVRALALEQQLWAAMRRQAASDGGAAAGKWWTTEEARRE